MDCQQRELSIIAIETPMKKYSSGPFSPCPDVAVSNKTNAVRPLRSRKGRVATGSDRRLKYPRLEAATCLVKMIDTTKRLCLAIALLATSYGNVVAQDDDIVGPYNGPSVSDVDTSTLRGKVMCGYQGWFNCADDGAELGWTHWARRRQQEFAPGNVTVDLWPDVSELDPDERFATGFRHSDGRVAEVFSSASRKTVLRHFSWMRDYGIDGAFVQRFANGLADPRLLGHKNNVLAYAREGANTAGRAYAVMYDLSGLRRGETRRCRSDWRMLRSEMEITADAAYLHQEGKPVVAIWGIGFSDGREYTLEECRQLIQWLKEDGCTVMVGVPTWWRTGRRDATDDPKLLEIIKSADIVSPWSVGRYQTPQQAGKLAKEVWHADLGWCQQNDIDFLPVVFPGFSWHNLHGGKLNSIPRRKGKFLWSQLVAAKKVGCEMIYVAMFDEVDEGTAIFKCTDDPPAGDGVTFSGYEGLPSDHYMRLVGEGGRMLRGEIPASETMPR
jgi:hypothetical protein